MPLIRLLYVSRRRPSTSVMDVRRIVFSAQVTNRRRDITGVLVELDGYFAQVLEGQAELVDPLVERIGTDPRHFDLRVVLRAEISSRLFDAWSMRHLYNPALQELVAQLHEGVAQPGSAQELAESLNSLEQDRFEAPALGLSGAEE